MKNSVSAEEASLRLDSNDAGQIYPQFYRFIL